MSSFELRQRNQSQSQYTRDLSAVWANTTQLHDPSVWLLRDPDAQAKMLRDADIRAAVDIREHAIAGKNWNLTPLIETSPRSDMAVHVGTELLKKIKHFTSARKLLASAFFSGQRWARIHGRNVKLTLGDGRVRTWWVPVRLEDLDKRMFRIVPKNDGETITAHHEEWDIAQRKWVGVTHRQARGLIRHTYGDNQAMLGHGTALREAVGWCWYAKEHVFQESLQAVERFAQGILHAKIDGLRDGATGLPNEEVMNKWLDRLEDFRSRHVIASDSSDSIEVISGSAEGHQLLADMRSELKTMTYQIILGSNLPSNATEGGSYALGIVQENTTEGLIQFDREILQETLTDDLLGCLWFKNWPNLVDLGVENERPLFVIAQEKRQDPQERTAVAQGLHAMGVPLAAEDLYEQTGYRKPDEGEDVIAGATAMPAAPAVPGFGFSRT